MRYLTLRRHRGFAVLTLSMILIAIVIFTSVSYARVQLKRASRIQIDLVYQQAKLDAEIGLDLLYMTLLSSPQTVSGVLATPYDGKLLEEHRISVPVNLIPKVNARWQLYAYPYSDGVIELMALVQPPDSGQTVRRMRRLSVVLVSGSIAANYQLHWLPYSDIDF